MADHFGNDDRAVARKGFPGTRAAWSTPRVIVSDLGDAQAKVDFGGDGSFPGYGKYGS